MNLILPNDSILGNLDIVHVYEYYDGPRLFNAVNSIGTNYIVFWIDTDSKSDSWLYSAISPSRLEALEDKKIKLRDVFTYPEENLFKVVTFFDKDEKDSEVERILTSSLNDSMLPPSSFYIQKTEAGADTVEISDEEQISISELYIKKKSGRGQPALNIVSSISGAWNDLYKTILKSLSFNSIGLTPLDARSGSYIMRMSSPKLEQCIPVIEQLFQILNNEEEPSQKIIELGINIEPVESLLAEITNGQVIFQLNKGDTYIADLNLTDERANSVLAKLKEHESTYISSLKVPQANDIQKVFTVVELKSRGVQVTPRDLNLTTDRQVAYYLHASRMLGYLDKSNTITSAGYQFSQMGLKRRMNSAAIRFESSECGWAWLKWAEASNICDLDANSAEKFLIEMCPSLSEDTSKRRAKTLRKWLIELTDYRFIDNAEQ